MKSSIFLIVSSLSFILITGFSYNSLAGIKGSSTIVESNFEIADFNGLDVSHAISVQIIQADEYKVVVKHNDNLKDYLVIEKSGSVLKLGLQNGHSYKNLKVSVIIHTPSLETIDLSGSSQVFCQSFKSEKLNIESSGASSFKGELNCEYLSVDGSGASSFNLMGEIQYMYCELSGASNLKAKTLTVQKELKVQASGASYISIFCNGEITTKLSGASSMHYYGSGSMIDQSVKGASTIKALEL